MAPWKESNIEDREFIEVAKEFGLDALRQRYTGVVKVFVPDDKEKDFEDAIKTRKLTNSSPFLIISKYGESLINPPEKI